MPADKEISLVELASLRGLWNVLDVFKASFNVGSVIAGGEQLAQHRQRQPEAYVSPAWYPSKQEHGKVVPTWNYVAVHAYGSAEFFEDADRLLDLVTQLTERHERPRAEPWAVTDAPAGFIRAQLRGIVGLRLPITRLEGKRKMSQNRSATDRAGVAAGLSASERASDRAMVALIPG